MTKYKIAIQEQDLPKSIRGLLLQIDTDDYVIMLNRDLSEQDKESAFLHECLHIYHNDFEGMCLVDELEEDRHAMQVGSLRE